MDPHDVSVGTFLIKDHFMSLFRKDTLDIITSNVIIYCVVKRYIDTGESMSNHIPLTRNIRKFICRFGKVRLSTLCRCTESGYSDQELMLQFQAEASLLRDIRQAMIVPMLPASKNHVSNH